METMARIQPDPKHLETALYHANIIENQKQIEKQILHNLVILVDYPQSSDCTAEAPNEKDVENATACLQLFRPADYEDLLEERRIEEHCAYILCPNPSYKPKKAGKSRFVNSSDGILRVVPEAQYNSYCSTSCEKRSVYLYSQISLIAPWDRTDKVKVKRFEFLIGNVKDKQIITFNPDDDKGLSKLSGQLSNLNVKGNTIHDPMFADSVVEKTITQVPNNPKPNLVERPHDAVEGYVPGESISLQRDDPLSFMD